MPGSAGVVVLTGATNGIGRVAAKDLAADGWTVAAVGRDRDRGESLVATADGTVHFYRTDLATQSAVRDLAADLADRYPTIDVLAHNAGLSVRERTETADGVELTLAVNHLAPYLLTHQLVDQLIAAAPARVVVTASTVHESGTLDFDDLHLEAGYDAMDAYARSKLAVVAFTLELAERLPDDITANCFHPGFIPSTEFFRDAPIWMRAFLPVAGSLPFVGATTGTGARRLRRMIEDPTFGERTGLYLEDGEMMPAAEARDPARRERLWRWSAELVGVEPDWP